MRWAQLVSWLVRFRTLPRAERVFAGIAPGTWLSRPYCGSRLWVDVGRSSTERLLFLEGRTFSPELKLLSTLLAPGMNVADVGANIGYYALALAAATGPSGSVHSIEPISENLRTLERNVEANGLSQVRIHRCAVGAANGTIHLQPGFNAFVKADGPLEVPMRRLDDLLPDNIDLIKIDIEGYEGHALAGARQLISRRRPALFVEVHPKLVDPPYSIPNIVAELSELYDAVELWEPRPAASWFAKLRARYGSHRVLRMGAQNPWQADLAAGRPRDPFWVVCRSPKPSHHAHPHPQQLPAR